MPFWSAIRNHIPGIHAAGADNATRPDTTHDERPGPHPGNTPPNRFRSFVDTVLRRSQRPPPLATPPAFLPALTITAADTALPGIDGNTIYTDAEARIAKEYADRHHAILGGLAAKTKEIENAPIKNRGLVQVRKLPIYRPTMANLFAQPKAGKSAAAAPSQKASAEKPLGHLPQRSYRQIMQILGQSEGAAPLSIATLAANLDKEIKGLESYKELAKNQLDNNKTPNKSISRNDGKFARHVIAMYNADNPALNAEVFDSPPNLIKYIKQNIEGLGRLRALFRMGSTEDILHHSAADIRVKNGKVTILCADPANFAHQNIIRSVISMDDALEELSPERRACAYIGVGAQNSPADCVEFGESFLKKMDDAEDFFDLLHDRLYNGEPLNQDPHIKPRKPEMAEAMEIAEEMIKDDLKNIDQAIPDARHFFPLAFYKHAHSPKDMQELLSRQPSQSDTKVNKPREGRAAQTLPERVTAHIPKDGRKHGANVLKYSISIEEKRLEEIDKTLEFFKGLKQALPSTE